MFLLSAMVNHQLTIWDNIFLGGGFKCFLFSPLFREDFQFDWSFSDGLVQSPFKRCFPTFFQASKSSKIYAYSDSIWDGLSHIFLNKQNWVETTKSAWNLKHPRIKMVVSQNPSLQNWLFSQSLTVCTLKMDGWNTMNFPKLGIPYFQGRFGARFSSGFGPQKSSSWIPLRIPMGRTVCLPQI